LWRATGYTYDVTEQLHTAEERIGSYLVPFYIATVVRLNFSFVHFSDF